MVSNIITIRNVLNRFTPQGQKAVLDLMRKNKPILDNGLGAFNKLPEIVKNSEQFDTLEKNLVIKDDSILSVYADALYNTFGKTIDNLEAEICNISDYYRESIFDNYIALFRSNFEGFRTKIIKMHEKFGDEKFLTPFKKAKTPEDLYVTFLKVSRQVKQKIYDRLHKMQKVLKLKGSNNGNKRLQNNRNSFPIEYLQEEYKLQRTYGDYFLQLQKVSTPKSDNPEILKIEKILRTKYGIEYVNITDLKNAQRILNAVEIAKANGVPMPKAIITPPLQFGFNGFNGLDATGKNCVYINHSKYENILTDSASWEDKDCLKIFNLLNYLTSVFKPEYSSKSRLHTVVHELVHSENAGHCLTNYPTKILSKEQKAVAETVSQYAANNGTEELRTELRTKQILGSLNNNEKKLLSEIS